VKLPDSTHVALPAWPHHRSIFRSVGRIKRIRPTVSTTGGFASCTDTEFTAKSAKYCKVGAKMFMITKCAAVAAKSLTQTSSSLLNAALASNLEVSNKIFFHRQLSISLTFSRFSRQVVSVSLHLYLLASIIWTFRPHCYCHISLRVQEWPIFNTIERFFTYSANRATLSQFVNLSDHSVCIYIY